MSFSEFGENSTCEESDKLRTNTWDAAAGADLEFEEGKSYTKAWLGTDVEPGGDWWFQTLSKGKYLTAYAVSNNVWRCSAVKD